MGLKSDAKWLLRSLLNLAKLERGLLQEKGREDKNHRDVRFYRSKQTENWKVLRPREITKKCVETELKAISQLVVRKNEWIWKTAQQKLFASRTKQSLRDCKIGSGSGSRLKIRFAEPRRLSVDIIAH